MSIMPESMTDRQVKTLDKNRSSSVRFRLLQLFLLTMISIALYTGQRIFYDHIRSAIDVELENDRTRAAIGHDLVSEFLHIQSTLFRQTIEVTDSQLNGVLESLKESVNRVQEMLLIIENGGEYARQVPMNIPNEDFMIERMAFTPEPEEQYHEEVLFLLSQVNGILERAQEHAGVIRERNHALQNHDLTTTQQSRQRVTQSIKELDPMISRMVETAGQLLYTSRVQEHQTRWKQERILDLLRTFSLGLGILLALGFIILFWRISRNIQGMHLQLEQLVAETERKNLQLLASDHKFRTIADFTYAFEYWLAPDGQLLYVSPSCERVTGYHRDQLLNNPGLLTEMVHPDDREAMNPYFSGKQNHNTGPLQFRITTPTGEIRWIQHVSQPVQDENGHYFGIRGSHIDDTERTQLQDQRITLERELGEAQRNESLSVMAGAIAHHFNNIMLIVQGNLELLQMEINGNTSQMKLLKGAQNAAVRATSISESMLTYVGQKGMKRTVQDVQAILSESVASLQDECPANIRLQYETDSKPAYARIDREEVNQVIRSLATNAFESINENDGQVAIRLLMQDPFDQRACETYGVDHLDNTPVIMVEIEDNGCGMTRAMRKRIFDPFFTTKFTGRGLGLAVASGIMRAHQGAIDVRSQPGRGTTARLILPRVIDVPDSWQSRRKEKSTRVDTLEGYTLLLVDDNPQIVSMGKNYLTRMGCDVITAGCGKQALEEFYANPDRFDLVILDVIMPDVSGVEVLHQVKERRPKLPVFLSSGYPEHLVEIPEGMPDADEFVKKPFALRELTRKIASHLQVQ